MEKDTLLQQYLDGELSPEEEREALHIIADDAEMRSMLRFEQKLSESLFHGQSFQSNIQVPEDFTDSVMHKIEQKEQSDADEGLIEKVKIWYRQLWVPKQFQWRPAYAFVVALLVLFSLSYPLIYMQNFNISAEKNDQVGNVNNLNDSVQQVSSAANEVMLRFIYIDEKANSVAVAGDFNDWEPVQLTKQKINGKTVWTGLVSMRRGEHNYMFVKNGDEWVTDPLAPVHRDDGFGNKNAVIYI